MDKYYEELGAFEVLYTDCWYFGTGFAWEFKKDVKFNFAVGQTFWDEATIEYVRAADNGFSPVEVKTKNTTSIIAVGFDVAF
jgi:long-subunit fatty acid transport protein